MEVATNPAEEAATVRDVMLVAAGIWVGALMTLGIQHVVAAQNAIPAWVGW